MKRLCTLMAILCLGLSATAQHTLVKQDVNDLTGSGAARFTSLNDKTYFIADDGTHGYELWWSDGHSYGMVADINPGSADAFDPTPNSGHNLSVWGNSLFFAARDSALGIQLWEYNGISTPVRRTTIKLPETVVGHVTAVQDKLYFKVAGLFTPMSGIYSFDPQTHVYQPINSTMMVSSYEPMASVAGKLLYYDGGASVPKLMEYDPVTGFASGFNVKPLNGYYVYNNTVFFLAYSVNVGIELYTYDGYTEPRRITDIRQGAANSFGSMMDEQTERMTVYNNKLYFMAMSATSAPYRNLFSYDPVTDAVTEVAQLEGTQPCRGMAVYGKKLFISTDSGAGVNTGMYVYDGSNVRHFSSLGFNTFTMPQWLTESNGRLFFADWDVNSPFSSYEAYVFTDSLALGVNEVASSGSVRVYPNPATSMVQIGLSLNENAVLQVVLTDMQGRVVYSAGGKQYPAGSHVVTVPVGELAAGVYMCTVTDAEGVVLGRGKVVKQ